MKRKTAGLIAAVMAAAAVFSVPASVMAAGYNITADKKTDNSFVLTWDEQDGADAYRVYIYDMGDEKYVAYKTVSGERCTVQDLEADTSYKLKIRALEKKKGKYKKISDSGAVKVKTLDYKWTSPAESSKDNTQKEYKYSATIKQMVTWKMEEKDMGPWDRARSRSVNFLNKFKNAGYVVEETPHIDGQSEQRYFINDKLGNTLGEVVVVYRQTINKVGDWSWGFYASFYAF